MNIKQIVKEMFSRIKQDWYLPVTEYQIYDSTERVIGTYMGKPLYRNTFINVPISTSGYTLVSDVDVFFNAPVIRRKFSTNVQFEIAGNGITDDDYVIFEFTNNVLKARAGSRAYKSGNATIVVEYTKTTDSTTQSKVPFEPLTEYSTEEKMIGYWVDGKPLYRKAVTYNVPSHSTGQVLTIPNTIVDDIENAVKIYGAVMFGNDAIPILYNTYINLLYTKAVGLKVWDANLNIGGGVLNACMEYTKTTD